MSKALPGELAGLRTFRARIVAAFAAGNLSCNCMGVTHDTDCPLGPIEVEADELRADELRAREAMWIDEQRRKVDAP